MKDQASSTSVRILDGERSGWTAALALASATWIAGGASAQAPRALSLGDLAPSREVQMLSVDGNRTTIGEAAGERGTLVIFTCNHCPWAQAWESRLVTLANAYLDRGVGAIAINSSDPSVYSRELFERMRERATAAGFHLQYSDESYREMRRRAIAGDYRFPYVVDATSDVARSFGATRTPEVFLFDARSRLVYHGAVDDNPIEPDAVEEHFLRDALQALVTGRPQPRAETRSVGCAIAFRE